MVVMQARPQTGTIPDAPGSYQFLDREGRVLYVGKAKSLRHRLPNYWATPLAPRTAQMMAVADRVEWVTVDTEVDALILEHSLIQTHQPRFNVRLKDDKSYPWLAVTVSDEWPRPVVFRGKKRKGVRYFGPYGHVGALRETIDLLLRSFPVRTCSDAKFQRHHRLGRPCLLYDIERCSGPCVGAVDSERYGHLVEELMRFLSGETAPVVARLTAEMQEAADALEYEQAARLRDRLSAVRKAAETQQMVSERPEDLDVVGIAEDELEAAVQVFFVRRGRVVGRKGFVADKVEDLSRPQLVGRVLEELYGAPGAEVPRRVLLPEMPDDAAVHSAWLSGLRGTPVHLAVPLRGDKLALHQTVTRNAAEDLARHRLKRAGDHNARARALTELQAALELPQAPLRIECFDMSHLQGTNYVGSMVVFEDGLALKSDYRHFNVKEVLGNDDVGAMEEVVRRRLGYWNDEQRATKFRRADLIIIDGGLPQLHAAQKAAQTLGLSDQVEFTALAKREELLYRPGTSTPIALDRGSESLYLVQRIRDEAHRFAITFHRSKRGKSMVASTLSGVEGLGPARQEKLLAQFGSLDELRRASLDELGALAWLPSDVATRLYDHLQAPAQPKPTKGSDDE